MRNLSKTFLRVNAVLSYVFAGLFALGAIIFFITGSPLISDLIAEKSEEGAAAYAISMNVSGGIFLGLTVMAILSGVFSNKASSQEKNALIMAIVFSALSGTEFGVAGGIIGLIANYKQARQDRINNIVDNQ
jgi:MFS family permease